MERPGKRLKIGSNPHTPLKKDRKQKLPVGIDYSLTGVTLGMATKTPMVEHNRPL
jgi:hypothetical protein